MHPFASKPAWLKSATQFVVQPVDSADWRSDKAD